MYFQKYSMSVDTKHDENYKILGFTVIQLHELAKVHVKSTR